MASDFSLGVDKTGGASFTVLGNIVDGWKGPGAKATTADTSVLADLFDTFAKSSIDPGEVTFQIAYDEGDSASLLLGDLLRQLTPAAQWQATNSDGGTRNFFALLTGMDNEVKKKSLVVCDITLKATGDPGYSHN